MSHANMRDLAGQTFGRLTVIERAARPAGAKVVWRCLCQCGTETFVQAANLGNGHTKSCGCWRRTVSASKGVTHGDTRRGRHAKEYKAWKCMLTRCEDAKHRAYPYYGGRGIRVCERWKDYSAFLADVGRKPAGRYSLDRIDNDGHYEPGNVRWATQSQQMRNYSRNVMLTHQGVTLCVTDWAKRLGFRIPQILWGRLRDGWSVERAMTTPVRGGHAGTFSKISPDNLEP